MPSLSLLDLSSLYVQRFFEFLPVISPLEATKLLFHYDAAPPVSPSSGVVRAFHRANLTGLDYRVSEDRELDRLENYIVSDNDTTTGGHGASTNCDNTATQCGDVADPSESSGNLHFDVDSVTHSLPQLIARVLRDEHPVSNLGRNLWAVKRRLGKEMAEHFNSTSHESVESKRERRTTERKFEKEFSKKLLAKSDAGTSQGVVPDRWGAPAVSLAAQSLDPKVAIEGW